MQLNKLFLFIVLLLSINLASAVVINNTVLSSSGLNTTINITQPWTLQAPLGEVIVDTNWIFAANLTNSSASSVSLESLTFNLTDTNARYSGSDAPYYAISDNVMKGIYMGFDGPVTAGMARIEVPYCSFNNVYYYSNASLYDSVISDLDCTGNILNFTIPSFEQGMNILRLDYDANITNCSDGNKTVQFTIKSEDIPTNNFTSDAEVYFNYWVNPYFKTNYSVELTGNHTYSLCIYPREATIRGDLYIKYTNTDGFTHRYYIINGTFTNETKNLLLYNTNLTALYSNLKVTTRHSENYSYYPLLTSNLERYYPGTNTWRRVQMDRSGDFGLHSFDIIERSTDYRLVFKDIYNRTLKRTDTLKFECDPTTNVCDLTVMVDKYSAASVPTGFTYSVDYSNATGLITIDWDDTLGGTSAVRVIITKETMGGTTDICDSTYYTSSGSSICNVSIYDGEVKIEIKQNGATVLDKLVPIGGTKLSDFISVGDSVFYTIAILATIMLSGVVSPAAVVITSIFGLIVIALLGIFTPVTTTFVMIAIVLGIAIAIKVKA